MSFDPSKLRLERLHVEAGYHAAFNFLSLKGALAERWAHGPVFGAYSETGHQVTLTPEAGSGTRRLHGVYGIRTSGFNEERVGDIDDACRLASEWLGDVFDVLKPTRTVKVATSWFALYPLSNAEAAKAASGRLRTHYYRADDLDTLMPADYPIQLHAVDSMCVLGDKHWSIVFGAVGPPHKGLFFVNEDAERDSSWWMGLRLSIVREDLEGLERPEGIVEELLTEGRQEYDRVTMRAFNSIF